MRVVRPLVKQQLSEGLFFPAPLFVYNRELLALHRPSKARAGKKTVYRQLSYQGTESKLRVKKEDLKILRVRTYFSVSI